MNMGKEGQITWYHVIGLVKCFFKPDFIFQPKQFKCDFSGETVQKPAFSSFSQLSPLFSETYGHQSQSFIHQIKPDPPHFEHLKYEPDLSTHARDKGGAKFLWTVGHPVVQGKQHMSTTLNRSIGCENTHLAEIH